MKDSSLNAEILGEAPGEIRGIFTSLLITLQIPIWQQIFGQLNFLKNKFGKYKINPYICIQKQNLIQQKMYNLHMIVDNRGIGANEKLASGFSCLLL